MTIGARLYYSTGSIAGGLADDSAVQIGTGPLRLMQIGGYSPAGNTDYYVMLFDSAVAIIAGVTPTQAFAVPAAGSFSWDPGLEGLKIEDALYFAISTTPGVYTASSGGSLFLFAQYVDLD